MSANITLTEATLMHERRSTPYPPNGHIEKDKFVSFQWPLPENARDTETTGKKVDKSKLKYKLRYSKDKTFTNEVITIDTIWPFYNPESPLESGTWYWQYGYKNEAENIEWSEINQVTVSDNPTKFIPPSFTEFKSKFPKTHPRVLVENDKWQSFINESSKKEESKWIIEQGDEALKSPMQSIDEIPTDH